MCSLHLWPNLTLYAESSRFCQCFLLQQKAPQRQRSTFDSYYMSFENSPSCRSEQSAVSPLVTFALATFQSTNTGMKLQYEEVRPHTGAQVMWRSIVRIKSLFVSSDIVSNIRSNQAPVRVKLLLKPQGHVWCICWTWRNEENRRETQGNIIKSEYQQRDNIQSANSLNQTG